MGTRRLYHEDGELRTFEATVLEAPAREDGRHAVVLDETAFYPTSGGQPHDTGQLGEARVVDVVEDGDRVVHVVDGDAPSGRVTGTVDWDRRMDHRRQHTGQHILSRAIQDTRGAKTVGFHLGEERCSIDLDRPLDDAALAEGEMAANRVVLDNQPVVARWYDGPEDAPEEVRSTLPDERPLRLVAVGEFDLNACCGTHVSRAGDVGPVKILRWEKNKGGVRVEFVCGERALADYGRRHRALRDLALDLTTEEFAVPKRVAALRDEHKQLRVRLEKTEDELRERLALVWTSEAGEGPLCRDLGPGREDWLAPMATRLAELGKRRVLLLAGDGEVRRLALACPPGDEARAGDLLREALTGTGGKGGGSDRLARGQVPQADLEQVHKILGTNPAESGGN